MYKSLQTYISELESRKDLIRVKRFTNPVLEMAELSDRMVKSGGKALLFENTGTDFPVLMNMFGSQERAKLALGIDSYDEIQKRIDQLFSEVLLPRPTLWNKLKLLPTLKQAAQWMPKISNKRGACQEVVMPQPDLSKLPILKCWAHDGGRFITLPMVHTKDPVSEIRNVGMYRMQVFSNDTTGMHWHRHKTGARHFQQFQSLNRTTENNRFPVAVALGGDPVYAYCATAPMPDNMDEYLLAGFLRNKQVNLVRCLTQPLEVPADADFIIEGYIDINENLVSEGPFGDHTGFYSLKDFYPLLHVTCITHRKDAVYPATVVGVPPQEDVFLSQATERIFLSPIRFALAPEIVDLHMPVEGVSHNLTIVKIKKDYPGQAVKVANALWGAGQMMFNKIMIVVDGEVEITNYTELLKYISQNYNPATDTYFSSGPLDILDHASIEPAFGGKICIDATSSFNENSDTKEICNKPLFAFIHKGDSAPDARVVVEFNEEVDVQDLATCVWLLGNNIDARRDCKIENNQLLVDATSKPEQVIPRHWPNVVCADDETIATVNAKWASYGLSKFIPSPSLKYKPLVKTGKAAMNEEEDDTPEIILKQIEEEVQNLDTTFYESPIGWLKIEASEIGIRSIIYVEEQAEIMETENEFIRKCIAQLDEYFAGNRTEFDIPIDPVGTDFQMRVWSELCKIKYGETISYAELAMRVNDKKAVRAVGHANGMNKINIIVPCHRVIGSNRKLVGYGGGLERKEWLLKHEFQFAGEGLFKR